ncbi:MAG: right-handed parallel beta-helix repeat-containing protein [Saccharospirillum sp.]
MVHKTNELVHDAVLELASVYYPLPVADKEYVVPSKIVLCWLLLLTISLAVAQAPAVVGCIEVTDSHSSYSAPAEVVTSTAELSRAIRNAEEGTVLHLHPGDYPLSATLAIRTDNISLVGAGENCSAAQLIGPGMKAADERGAPHAIWTNASGLRVENLTIQDFPQHGIILNPGAQAPVIRNVRIQDTGQQMIKANPTSFGVGVNDGLVEHSEFVYTEGPSMVDSGGSTGYTNGVNVHAGANWVIRHSRFENFHTPDSADHLWNPVILMWNGARDTLVKNNEFYNVDRAIAFGLLSREEDHAGGVIAHNHIEYSPGLYSPRRRAGSDGAIIVWSSPGTLVRDNTVLTRGNLRRSIEFRFTTDGAVAVGNTVDALIGGRDGARFEESGTLSVGD